MRHLLVAISNDAAALHGVKFVSGFFHNLERIKVTLFASLPGDPRSDATTGTTPLQSTTERSNHSSSFISALETSRTILEDAGMPPENITDRVEACVRSVDFHLALESAVGMYDALVLGRRGVETLSQLISESLSERLFQSKITIPCWACRHFEPGRRGVLLCVDYSSGYAAVARHVASICTENADQAITLLHVRSPGTDHARTAMLLDEAEQLLFKEGIGTDRIRSLQMEDEVAARAILREAEEGRFAAVAIGKGRDAMENDTFGPSNSTGRTLLRDLTGAGLWFTG